MLRYFGTDGVPHVKRVVALGFFDGIHLGHRRLIRGVLEQSRSTGAISSLLTFDPHPEAILYGGTGPKLLTTLDEKAYIVRSLGIQELIIIPFTREFASQTPAEFVKTVLADALSAMSVWVGYNFTFGFKGMGDPSTLCILAEQHGFSVSVMPPVRVDDQVVSSTHIRRLVERGDLAAALRFIGQPYSVLLEGEKGVWPLEKASPPPGKYVLSSGQNECTLFLRSEAGKTLYEVSDSVKPGQLYFLSGANSQVGKAVG